MTTARIVARKRDNFITFVASVLMWLLNTGFRGGIDEILTRNNNGMVSYLGHLPDEEVEVTMKNPCTTCHWLKRILCIFACKEYNKYFAKRHIVDTKKS